MPVARLAAPLDPARRHAGPGTFGGQTRTDRSGDHGGSTETGARQARTAGRAGTRTRRFVMALTKVWIRTLADGLIRADQVIGLATHPAPSIAGSRPRWLLDATLAVPVGSGAAEEWNVTVLHRTLLQTDDKPLAAPETLARLLASLDAADAAGVITPASAEPPHTEPTAAGIRFVFDSFEDTPVPDTTVTSNRHARASEHT